MDELIASVVAASALPDGTEVEATHLVRGRRPRAVREPGGWRIDDRPTLAGNYSLFGQVDAWRVTRMGGS